VEGAVAADLGALDAVVSTDGAASAEDSTDSPAGRSATSAPLRAGVDATSGVRGADFTADRRPRATGLRDVASADGAVSAEAAGDGSGNAGLALSVGLVALPVGFPVVVRVGFSETWSAFRDEALAGFAAAVAVGTASGSAGESAAADGAESGWAAAARVRADREDFDAAVAGGGVGSWVGMASGNTG